MMYGSMLYEKKEIREEERIKDEKAGNNTD